MIRFDLHIPKVAAYIIEMEADKHGIPPRTYGRVLLLEKVKEIAGIASDQRLPTSIGAIELGWQHGGGMMANENHGTTRIRAQRAANGLSLGACLSIGAADLSFVDSGVEWLTVEKKMTEDKLILTITAAIP